MKKFCIASILFSFLLFSNAAEARNLGGRLGVGFTNQIAVGPSSTIPAISGKYYLSKATALSGGLGFDTKSGDSIMALGMKAYHSLFFEENLIFYTGIGLAYVSRITSKFQVSGFLGTEFFLQGLPSLGFSFEVGIRGDSTSGAFAIRTIGDSFLTAGMHFYF